MFRPGCGARSPDVSLRAQAADRYRSGRRIPCRGGTASGRRPGGALDTEVLGIRLGGDSRAYPAWALARPYAVTDDVGGQRVVIS